MPKKSRLVFKVLTNKIHPNDDFKEHLSEEESLSLKEVDVKSSDTSVLLKSASKWLTEIHYSWLVPHIKKFPPSMIPVILHAFDQRDRKGLSELLGVKPGAQKPGESVADYYLKKIKEMIVEPNILPKEYLPESSLNPLLDLSKSFLVEVVDLLGVHDLGEKIRQVVDKTRLRAIYQCLSPVQLKYLEFVLRQTERVSLSELELSEWDGNPDKLNLSLHKGGLTRLGKAISRESPDYVWHLYHKLDTGRADFIGKAKENVSADMAEHLKTQVITIVNLINHKRDS